MSEHVLCLVDHVQHWSDSKLLAFDGIDDNTPTLYAGTIKCIHMRALRRGLPQKSINDHSPKFLLVLKCPAMVIGRSGQSAKERRHQPRQLLGCFETWPRAWSSPTQQAGALQSSCITHCASAYHRSTSITRCILRTSRVLCWCRSFSFQRSVVLGYIHCTVLRRDNVIESLAAR